MKKHLLIILIIAVSLFILAACTGGEGTTDTIAPIASDSDTATPTEPVTRSDTEAASTPVTDAVTTAADETPTEPTTEASDLLAEFAVLSDIHIGKSNVDPKPEAKFESALQQIGTLMPGCQAVAVAGDMTDLGTDAQYETLLRIWNENKPTNAAFAPCLGNHEFFRDGVVRFGGESETFLKECRDAYQKYLGDLYTDTVVGGVHIIAVSCDSSAAQYAGAEQFLIDHVKAAAQENPNMPIIIIAHQGLGTYYNDGGGVFTAKTTRELQKYPQIIVFSGHTHYSAYDPRMIQQKHFTTVQTGTVGADFWNYNYIQPLQPPRKDEVSEGHFVTVSKAGVVTIHRYDFTNSAAIGEPWIIDIPAVKASTDAFAYTDARKQQAADPVFPERASINAAEVTASSATISWPVPTVTDSVSDGQVIHYTVSAVERDSGAVFGKTVLLSEYYLCSGASDAFTHTITGLLPDSTYDVTVVAETAWGKTATLTGTLTTKPDETSVDDSDAKILLDVDYTSGSPEDQGAYGLTLDTYGKPTYADGAVILDKESVYGYRLTKEIYEQIPANFSIECEVYIDPDQTFPWGYVTLVGNTESGGFCIDYFNNGQLALEINIGGTYQKLSTPVSTGKWVHILATYNGQIMNIYCDGILAASQPCSGNIKHVGPNSQKLMIGADVNGDGSYQCSANIRMRMIRLYDKGLSAKTAFELANKENT